MPLVKPGIDLRDEYYEMLENNNIKPFMFNEFLFFRHAGATFMRGFEIKYKKRKPSVEMLIVHLKMLCCFRIIKYEADIFDDRTTIGLKCHPDMEDDIVAP